MAYDAVRQVTVLFGGWNTNEQGALVTLGDLWEWDSVRWTLRQPHTPTGGWAYTTDTGWRPAYTDRPVSRTQHGLAFDSARGRVVLFGGQSFSPDSHQVFLNDTWEWDGVAWQFRANSGPAPRSHPALACDRDRGVTVMTGGFLNGSDPTPGAVWEWNGTEWTMRSAPNGPSTSYSQDVGGMAYDSVRKVILFGPSVGESSRWAFWEWDGQRWQRAQDTFVAALYGLQYGDLTFDTRRRRAVWFGGQPASNQTGFFDGQKWELLTNNPTPPSGRFHLALAYDVARRATVMFGGETANTVFNGETWELLEVDVPLITENPVSLVRKAGETATFQATARGPAGSPLSYQWYHDGAPLADGARVSGAQTPILSITQINSSDTGGYLVRIRNAYGESASPPAILTLHVKVEISLSSGVINLKWTDPDVVLEETDSLNGSWTRVSGATSPFSPAMSGARRFYRLRPAGGP
jgi:hypothetical protein